MADPVPAETADRVKVKRDGPRGWHWITAGSFDPARHELVDPPAAEQPVTIAETKRRGRPPKVREPIEGVMNGNR